MTLRYAVKWSTKRYWFEKDRALIGDFAGKKGANTAPIGIGLLHTLNDLINLISTYILWIRGSCIFVSVND